MGEQEQRSLEGAVQSYAHWWREAGFHTAIDIEPHGWREGLQKPFWQRDAASTPAPAAHAPAAPAPVVQSPAPSVGMPTELRVFLDWLGQDQNHPEALWDGPAILPPSDLAGKLLILVEMPAMGASDAGTLLDPAQHRFIGAMLASIGVAPDDAAIVPLAMRRPPGGLLDEETLGKLSARMRHFLSLARPAAAIVLGDRTSRAVIGTQWTPGAERLQSLNVATGMIDALALTALDLLMNRPAAKMRSWQALRLLHRRLLHGVLNG